MPEAGFIREIFAAISSRYDLLNRVLSLGTDRRWRDRAVAAVTDGVSGSNAPRILDVCCGTGDLTLALAGTGAWVAGADFCHEMLVLGREKAAHLRATLGRSNGAVHLAEADALRLPFRDGAFAGVTVAFGVRNLSDLGAGLKELLRVLEPGGRLAILEFGRPRGRAIGALYALYLNVYVPVAGRLLSGSRDAYEWLASSIQAFPDQSLFPERLGRAGFTEIRAESLTFGIAALYVATKPNR